eukprot:SAG25_NODE_118_length_14760_cov_873.663666_23_plen_141_part_00
MVVELNEGSVAREAAQEERWQAREEQLHTEMEELGERLEPPVLYARRFHSLLSVVADVHLWRSCSCHEILRMGAPGQVPGDGQGGDPPEQRAGLGARRGRCMTPGLCCVHSVLLALGRGVCAQRLNQLARSEAGVRAGGR